MKRNYTLIPLCLVLLAFIACSNNTKKASDDTETTTKSVVNVPQFNADSAYQYVKAQVDFGPRVPNTSGVGVLLEIARHLQKQLPEMGIDIVFVDAEDYGTHQAYNGPHKEEYWGLGSQYWARNPHVQGYNARFGILLDMVGGKNAEFRYESLSHEVAPNVNEKVWKTANALGFGRYFVQKKGGFVTDDHTFINKYAKIPTIDIVPYYPEGDFFEHWHTVKDDMDAIDKATLQAVGQTVMQVIYSEK